MAGGKTYPKYSVLMSVYYKEKPEWFSIAIDCMLNQTVKPSEFVIVCDGNLTKQLDEVIEEKIKNNSIFKVVRLEKNVGLGPALARGVNECSNELIARMDSDDYSRNDRIEKQLDYLLENPSIGMVGSNVAEFSNDITKIVSNVILPETHEEIEKYSKKRNPFRHPTIIFKKSEVLRAGNYKECYLCEDYDMWIRMIQNGTRCYNIQEQLVEMRISSDFYARRGGLKYFNSVKRFKKKQVKSGYFTRMQYLKSITPHLIVCFMPNAMRDFVYRKLLRS